MNLIPATLRKQLAGALCCLVLSTLAVLCSGMQVAHACCGSPVASGETTGLSVTTSDHTQEATPFCCQVGPTTPATSEAAAPQLPESTALPSIVRIDRLLAADAVASAQISSLLAKTPIRDRQTHRYIDLRVLLN